MSALVFAQRCEKNKKACTYHLAFENLHIFWRPLAEDGEKVINKITTVSVQTLTSPSCFQTFSESPYMKRASASATMTPLRFSFLRSTWDLLRKTEDTR